MYLHAWYARPAARQPWEWEAASPLPLASVPAQAAAFPQLSGEAQAWSPGTVKSRWRGAAGSAPGSRLPGQPAPPGYGGLHCEVNTGRVRLQPCLQSGRCLDKIEVRVRVPHG